MAFARGMAQHGAVWCVCVVSVSPPPPRVFFAFCIFASFYFLRWCISSLPYFFWRVKRGPARGPVKTSTAFEIESEMGNSVLACPNNPNKRFKAWVSKKYQTCLDLSKQYFKGWVSKKPQTKLQRWRTWSHRRRWAAACSPPRHARVRSNAATAPPRGPAAAGRGSPSGSTCHPGPQVFGVGMKTKIEM